MAASGGPSKEYVKLQHNNEEIRWLDGVSAGHTQILQIKSGQPFHIIYIRELSFSLAGCVSVRTIQPRQAVVMINCVWTGLKPLLGSDTCTAAMTTQAFICCFVGGFSHCMCNMS